MVSLYGHQDPQFFVKAHQEMGLGAKHNFTTMRLLYYPPLPAEREIKPGQLRCGEHVDYGSITLLFQDPNGGLQVNDTAVVPCGLVVLGTYPSYQDVNSLTQTMIYQTPNDSATIHGVAFICSTTKQRVYRNLKPKWMYVTETLINHW